MEKSPLADPLCNINFAPQVLDARVGIVLVQFSRMRTRNEYHQWLLRHIGVPLSVKSYGVSLQRTLFVESLICKCFDSSNIIEH
jgi:hypothetical protein